MRTLFELHDGLTLALPEPEHPATAGADSYPTASLQRGLLLTDGHAEICGEGVGFGVPVLKRGARAVFAGQADLVRSAAEHAFTVSYEMDRAERFGGRRGASPLLIPLDLVREVFALLYRRAPALRPALMAGSNGMRRLLRVRTRFELIPSVARIPVTYSLGEGEGELRVRVELTGLPPEVTEVVVMNELGAEYFSEYTEEGGRTETGGGIGAWNLVRGGFATFGGGPGRVWFRLERAADPAVPARLYHGREASRGRLAWAGFGYSFPPGPSSFTYTVRIGRETP